MNQRFKEITNELKNQRRIYSDADLARILGISRGEMSNVMSGKRPVSKRIVDNMSTHFPEINKNWLQTGEGEMIKSSDIIQDSPITATENHSTTVTGYKNTVNSDPTIAKLIDELAAQRRLTESAQEALLTALKQNTMLINKLK